MLVLMRRPLQRVIITLPDGRVIRVQFVKCKGDRAYIGFEAPLDVTVHREEIQALIDAEAPPAGEG